MRPIDFCHPYETACTRTSHVPGYAAATFAAWAPPEVWASSGLTGGPNVFTTLGTLRRIVHDTRFDDVSCVVGLVPDECLLIVGASVGVFFPRCHGPTEPLTSLSPLLLSLAVSPTFAGFSLGV
jgi:hypothetical protein